ncbi:MAG: cysteine hydrolase [Coriobacteriia bacterium]|nr:cysteine hydrolase [Coriobacteriia bacterium]MCL2537250.1 cysteine hydrolase [Coriobacteriia bacterium]
MKVLIVIDMQNDFITGSLGTPEAQAIVGECVHRISSSRGELILFTQDTHGEDYLETPEGTKLPVVHCLDGSEGWQIEPSIMQAWRENTDTITDDSLSDNSFSKPVFGSTELVDYLTRRAAEIEGIELIGVCTDICVVSNALMIKNTLPDIPVSVDASLCAGVTPTTHAEALSVMNMCQIEILNN